LTASRESLSEGDSGHGQNGNAGTDDHSSENTNNTRRPQQGEAACSKREGAEPNRALPDK
jgi:hypothetical protein